MRTLLYAIISSFFCVSVLSAGDTPIKSLSEEKGTETNCISFIKNEASRLKRNAFHCRAVIGIVFVCDNALYHSELSCEGSKAWMEVFVQDGTNWKRFYVD